MNEQYYERPNILLIVSDDHGYGDRSYLGLNSDVNTPGLDSLAKEGMSFNRAYVTAPICSPSRSSLICGSYQARWGSKWFNSSSFPPESFDLLPVKMKEAGYRTGYFGKIHYGRDNYGERSCPEQHGFDESFYGLAALSMGRLHYMKHGDEYVKEYGDEYNLRHGVEPMVENGEKVSCHTHLSIEFANRASEFMLKEDDKPFFCMLCFNAVHNFCWQLPDDDLARHALPRRDDYNPDIDKYVDWYDGSIRPNLDYGREYYLAQLELMDRQISSIIDKLEEAGIRDNTLIVYMTDNGGSPCNYGDNGKLAGSKYTLYEGGIRVPMIISKPGWIPKNIESDALVSSLDLMPTFLDYANYQGDFFTDGKSLRPVLEQAENRQHDYLFFDSGFSWAVVTPFAKLQYVDGDNPQVQAIENFEHCKMSRDYSLYFEENGLFKENESDKNFYIDTEKYKVEIHSNNNTEVDTRTTVDELFEKFSNGERIRLGETTININRIVQEHLLNKRKEFIDCIASCKSLKGY